MGCLGVEKRKGGTIRGFEVFQKKLKFLKNYEIFENSQNFSKSGKMPQHAKLDNPAIIIPLDSVVPRPDPDSASYETKSSLQSKRRRNPHLSSHKSSQYNLASHLAQ